LNPYLGLVLQAPLELLRIPHHKERSAVLENMRMGKKNNFHKQAFDSSRENGQRIMASQSPLKHKDVERSGSFGKILRPQKFSFP
jgi:hypothetical protein